METISKIDESSHQHNNLALCDTCSRKYITGCAHLYLKNLDNIDTSSMFTENINNLNVQNQNTEEINENNIYDGNSLTPMINTYLDERIVDDELFRFLATTSLLHENQSPIHYSLDHELQQLDRLDDVWIKNKQLLRNNENRLTRRNVPRLMVLLSAYKIYDINCMLHMLLNAPVFIRITRKLQKFLEESIPNLQSIQNIPDIDNEVRAKRDLFYSLAKIIKMAFEEKRNDDVDVPLLLNSLRDKYQALYLYMNDWNEQDPDKFYINWMNVLQFVAKEMNQTDLISKALEITSSVITDGEEPVVKKDYVIPLSSNHHDFTQWIDKHYTGVIVERANGQVTSRTYRPLPNQLLATTERQQNGNHVPYSYPAEFVTCCNQRYLFTGAIVRNVTSRNCDHYSVVIRRQDCVYLFNNYHLVDRFHIDYLPIFFNTVHARALLYTEVDPSGEYVCTFEDPLSEIQADKPAKKIPCCCKRENLTTSIPSNIFTTSIDTSSVILRHPILSTFRFYYHSDFQSNINPDIPKLSDCLNGNPLYIWPRSIFVGHFIECTLVFKAPDGKFYRSHYQFVFNEPSGKRFENPTHISIDEDNMSTDEWFPLKLTISKPKQDVLEAKDKRTNTIVQDNQHSDTCQLVRYPDGEKEEIDQKKLLSFEKDQGKKKTTSNKRGPQKKSQKVTPHKLSKIVDLNTLYLAVRRARWLADEKKYVPDSDNLFYSNGIKPVSTNTKKCEYDYSTNLLQITELSLLPITLSDETDIYTIHLSYLIPDMYQCTSLRDKYIQITILTGADEDPSVHPVYQFLAEENRVSSTVFSVNEYSAT